MALLDEILETKRGELPELRRRRWPAPPTPRKLSLHRSQTGRVSVLAEFKRRSPSAGVLSNVLSVEERAHLYERCGAAVMSVLCDRTYFDGSYEDLAQARAVSSIPLLCKEFIIDEVQLDAAAACGADAVLLIARCLTEDRLVELLRAAKDRSLAPLVEVFQPEEVGRALDAGAEWIGVNARDLSTLKLDIEKARQILESLPSNVTKTHLSGVGTPEQAQSVRESPADAVLIGECLMRQADPAELLTSLVAACRG